MNSDHKSSIKNVSKKQEEEILEINEITKIVERGGLSGGKNLRGKRKISRPVRDFSPRSQSIFESFEYGRILAEAAATRPCGPLPVRAGPTRAGRI